MRIFCANKVITELLFYYHLHEANYTVCVIIRRYYDLQCAGNVINDHVTLSGVSQYNLG